MNNKELETIKELPFFTKETLRTLSSDSESTLDESIKRFLANGDLIKIKNGVYTTRLFLDRDGNSSDYRAFLATILKSPSYLSLEYVLSKYGVLTDVTYGYTSVTTKTGRNYKNSFGTYSYFSIKDKLFSGFITKFYLNNSYYEATKAKALFDYLYVRMSTLTDSLDVVEEFRLNFDDFTKSDLDELFTYAEISNIKVLKIVANKLYAYISN